MLRRAAASAEGEDVNPHILLVEDEPGLRLTLGDRLRAEGYRLTTATDLAQARGLLEPGRYDLVILDRMLPDGDGLDLCRELRELPYDGPVLMLTARGEVEDRVAGLRGGADDYLVKPFDHEELLARAEALLRRVDLARAPQPSRSHSFGDVVVDLDRAEVRVAGEPVEISARLYKLLVHLVENPERLHSRDDLLTAVWGYDNPPSTRTVDVHIAWLRQRIEPDPSKPVHIVTVHGMGYRFEGAGR